MEPEYYQYLLLMLVTIARYKECGALRKIMCCSQRVLCEPGCLPGVSQSKS